MVATECYVYVNYLVGGYTIYWLFWVNANYGYESILLVLGDILLRHANIERANVDVKLRLTDFEGPIDLLLHLVRERKMDIKTVKLGDMTKQYIEYLYQLPTLNMDLASEFIEVGATLAEIKSRQILPKPITETEEEYDAEEMLRTRLEEYNLFKTATEDLKPLDNVDRFYRAGEIPKASTEWKLEGVGFDDLTNALTAILARVGKSPLKIEKTTIKLDRFTVSGQIKDIMGRLKATASLNFSQLFAPDMTRSEVINTFLAVLELLKNQIIIAKQEKDFGDIEIVKGGAYHDGSADIGTEFIDN